MDPHLQNVALDERLHSRDSNARRVIGECPDADVEGVLARVDSSSHPIGIYAVREVCPIPRFLKAAHAPAPQRKGARHQDLATPHKSRLQAAL